ncbi:hypothetical protein G3O06_05040 [Burkholderia sp. Ac-20345]|uniref:hypothetical protein n=1 Tax=Burkholderia sp. Ac-20345 TaxID=2703891 RepID=UPI00197CA436|nr:hypothetical protein [Burkholderia sp. Ac-20345]MBN3776937.1 hypothetical protein [Burkholderia sp. Ac-20345]
MKAKIIVGMLVACLSAHAASFDWSAKSIQVEKQYSSREWGAWDPISLGQNSSYSGDGVGDPNTDLNLHAFVVDGKVLINRKLTVNCRARKIFESGFDESVLNMPWEVEIHSPCGTWRYTLVDTAKAMRPRLAAPGEVIPTKK